MQRPLGAQISHMLKARGVDVVFGIPGVHNQELYRGMEQAGITHVLARHEQGAGFMADGYARATGKPGVAVVITGPGLCNILTPMGQAYSDSVPMLVISSCLDEITIKKGQLHQMKDQRGAAETVCDWSHQADTEATAFALIDRALSEFSSQRARPKHIQVPMSVLKAPAHPAAPRVPAALVRPSQLEASVVQQAADQLRAARKPAMIVGGGARDAVQACRDLVHRLQPAAFCTYAGRGILSAGDPHFLGSILARPQSADILRQADALLVVGSELAEVDLGRDALGHSCPMIRIDCDPSVLMRDAVPGDIRILGAADEMLTALGAALSDHTPVATWSAEALAGTRARCRTDIDTERPGIVPICDALKAVLPEDTMIYSDMTQFAYAAKEVWDMPLPSHWHHPTGFGTLGYATPAAIGGAVARPGKPTLAIIGDYGFHYTMQELGVAVELGLSLPILLWDNGKLKEIEDSMVRAQIAPHAVVARNPDFCKLAEAFGAASATPSTLSDLQRVVLQAFQTPGPTLIRVTPEMAL